MNGTFVFHGGHKCHSHASIQTLFESAFFATSPRLRIDKATAATVLIIFVTMLENLEHGTLHGTEKETTATMANICCAIMIILGHFGVLANLTSKHFHQTKCQACCLVSCFNA